MTAPVTAHSGNRVTSEHRAISGNMLIGEYLGFLKSRPKEERWQLIEGIATMMNPPTLVHQLISLNLCYRLHEALERKGLKLLVVNESGVRIPDVAHFLPRPDVIVMPEVTDYRVYAERFLLTAEALSPSNTKSLIARKLRRYKEHPDNLYCLVIDSRRTWMQVHARATDWEPVTLDDPADVFELPEFALRSTLGDLYRHTPLDPERAAKRGRS